MEVNKDEAERCKTIAANALQQGSYDKAVKFLKKSLSLYPLPGVEALLATAERARDTNNNSSGTSFDSTRSGNNNNGSGYTNANTSPNTNTSSSNNANARASSGGSYSSRTTSTGSESNNSSTSIPSPSGPSTRSTSNVSESGGGHGRSYTQAQVDIVEKILKAKDSGRGAHYRVLEVNVNCTEADLKKSYRKIALKVHPDKNSAPRADDAFKAVGLAFATLSDTQKRAIYDRYGDEDPDNRGGGGGGGGGMRRPGGGVHFRPGQEVSPEDIFNMFFGGMPGGMGGGGGGMHRGPGGVHFYSNFGGPAGFGRAQQQQQARRAGGAQQQQQQQQFPGMAYLMQLLPLLMFVILSFMNMNDNTSTGGTSSTTKRNSPGLNRYFSLTNKEPFVNPLYTKLTQVKDIPYYVDGKFMRTLNRDRYQLAQVERMVENAYENYLVDECNVQRTTKKGLLAEVDRKVTEEEREIARETAQQSPLTRCVELNDLFPLRHAGRKR